MLIKGRDKKIAVPLALFLLAVSIWSLGVGAHALSETTATSLFWSHFLHFGAVPLPFFYLLFITLLLNVKAYKLLSLIAVLAIFFIFQIPSKDFIKGVTPILSFNGFPKAGPLYSLFLIYFFLCVLFGFYLLIKEIPKSTGVNKKRLQLIFWGPLLGFIFGPTAFLPMYNVPVFPFGTPLVVLNAVLIAYAILSYKLLDINLTLRYFTIGVYLSLLLGSPIAILVGLLTKNLTASIICLAAPVFGYLSVNRLRSSVTAQVDQLPPFKGRYLGPKQLLRVFEKLRGADSIEQLPHLIISLVKGILPTKSISVLLREPNGKSLLVKASDGLESPEAIFLSLPLSSSLAIYLCDTMSSCWKDFVGEELDQGKSNSILEDMSFLSANICVPIFFRGELKMVINVGGSGDDRPFNEVDIGNLNQLAQKTEQRVETIISGLNTEQQTSVWAHDLLKPFGTKGSFGSIWRIIRGDFGSISPEATKLLSLVLNDAKFVANNLSRVISPKRKGEFDIRSCSISNVYSRVSEKISLQTDGKKINWSSDEPPTSVRVLMDDIIIEFRVILNLVENAFRHTPPGGTVNLGYKLSETEFVGWVSDTGPGIREEDQKRLFQPGVQLNEIEKGLAGLGLASTKSVIEAHHGRVWVESEWGKGATFFFSLPLEKKT